MKDLTTPKQKPVKIGEPFAYYGNTCQYHYFKHSHKGRTYYSRYKHTTDHNSLSRFSSKSFSLDLDAKRWESSESKLLKKLA
jgi:hypothetical protein